MTRKIYMQISEGHLTLAGGGGGGGGGGAVLELTGKLSNN